MGVPRERHEDVGADQQQGGSYDDGHGSGQGRKMRQPLGGHFGILSPFGV
jgi:hypothetical protein